MMSKVLQVLAVVSAVVLAASAQASGDNLSSLVSKSKQDGAKLGPLVQKQWTDKVAQQKKNLSAEVAAIKGAQSSQTKAGVDSAIQVLNGVEQKVEANITAFAKTQVQQITNLTSAYSKLLDERSNAKVTEEEPIHQLKRDEQQLLNQWEQRLGRLHEFAHQAWETTLRDQATVQAKKSSNPQVGDAVRVAVTDAGVRLLQVLIGEQNADTTLLTQTQFNRLQNYTQTAEDTLIQLLVKAKQAKQA